MSFPPSFYPQYMYIRAENPIEILWHFLDSNDLSFLPAAVGKSMTWTDHVQIREDEKC